MEKTKTIIYGNCNFVGILRASDETIINAKTNRYLTFFEGEGYLNAYINAYGIYSSDEIYETYESGDNWDNTTYCMTYSTDDFGGFDAEVYLDDKTVCISYNASTGEETYSETIYEHQRKV